jgi:hypothetical protein
MAIDRSQVAAGARQAAATAFQYANKAADKVTPKIQQGAQAAGSFAKAKIKGTQADKPIVQQVVSDVVSGFERPSTIAGRATSGVNAAVFGTAAATSVFYVPVVSSFVNGASVALSGAVEYGIGVATKNNGLKQAGSLAMTTAVTAAIAGIVPYGDTAVYSAAALVALKNTR